jgi:hypothetical protein
LILPCRCHAIAAIIFDAGAADIDFAYASLAASPLMAIIIFTSCHYFRCLRLILSVVITPIPAAFFHFFLLHIEIESFFFSPSAPRDASRRAAAVLSLLFPPFL